VSDPSAVTTASVPRDETEDRIDAVAVVIPARNEEELVSRALHAVRRAAHYTQSELGGGAPRIEIVLVADDCHDATARLAREVVGVQVYEIAASTVGAARATGIDHALASFVAAAGVPAKNVWIANTDADSVVPPHWISDQVRLARAGSDVMIGTVRPDFADLSPDQISHWLATHTPGEPNGHVHGANLGVRANLYLAAGGFHVQPEHEDVDLVIRLGQSGARVIAADTSEVLTSGRLLGRTPSGYAGFLRSERSRSSDVEPEADDTILVP
jgi:glycosyltransferase involved in cell wall biosynthesis